MASSSDETWIGKRQNVTFLRHQKFGAQRFWGVATVKERWLQHRVPRERRLDAVREDFTARALLKQTVSADMVGV